MLTITRVDFIAIDLVVGGENSIIDGIGNSKVDKAKIGAKIAKFKSQGKIKGKTRL